MGERSAIMRLLLVFLYVCVASASAWLPGSSCRWCTVDKTCHDEGSMYNTCLPYENIYDPAKCGATPAPAPAPAPTDGGFSRTVLKELFKLLKITDGCGQLCQLGGPGGRSL